MSALTEEQRRRIEENRRKALERRAQKTGNSATPTTPAAKAYNGNSFSSFNSVFPSKSVTQNAASAISSSKPILVSSNKPIQVSTNKPIQVSTKPIQVSSSTLFGTSNSSKPPVKETSFKSPEIRGQCKLLSRKRFYVDVGYHRELIDIFKSIPSKLYDVQTKKWNFPIEDHDKLVSLVKPLQPNVLLVPLPRPLVNVFVNKQEKKEINEYDLSQMDQVLVQALLPFQKIGLYFGIQHGGRVLIADDMGLGKTIQGIAIANYFQKDWPLLIVTPSSVRYSWLEAIHKWLPSVEHCDISVINSGKDHIPNDKIIIMSYDLLTKMKDNIVSRKFKSVIFDESHFLKSHKSARTRAAQAIMKIMNRIIMLSGTPALSRPIELFTQLSALCPKYFSSFEQYGIRYCNGHTTQWGWDFNGSSNMEELQLLLEELVMIRRLKSDVIKQLPSKSRQMIILDPSRVSNKSKIMRAMFERMRDVNLRGMERRGALLEFFHETGAVKIPAVCDYIIDLLESDKKFLCFAHHQNVLDSICECIRKKKVDFIRIDGSVPSEQRKKLCDRFQLNDICKVAVLSITSANCGITLTAANLVVFAELFWNPGILTQAEDRAHRIGQEDSVLVQYLVAKGTADDEIWPLVQRKLDTLNKAGLSKDNFKTADTVVREDSNQMTLDEFLEEFDSSQSISDTPSQDIFDTPSQDISGIPEKRLKLDL